MAESVDVAVPTLSGAAVNPPTAFKNAEFVYSSNGWVIGPDREA